MTVTALPPAPSRADPSTFSTRADALLSALVSPFVTEVNATAATVTAAEANAVAQAAAALASADDAAISAASAAAYDNATGTSTTSMTISVANGKAFTTQSGKSWVAGMPVVAYNSAGNQMFCTVASYASTTLTLDCQTIIGSGTYTSWSFYAQPTVRLPILSAAASSLNAVTAETPVDSIIAHGAGNVVGYRIEYGSTQFVGAFGTTGTVRTSPDGTTWTARTVTGLAASNVDFRMRGSNGIAFGASGTSAISKTTDSGVTWSAGTSLPGTLTGTIFMAYNGGTVDCLVGTSTGGYVTTDNGATWSALQTFPATFTALTTLGSLYIGCDGSNTYISTTGLTGSWTTTAMSPASGTGMFLWDSANGILACGSTAGSTVYRSTNGTSWTSLGCSHPTNPDYGLVNINGNYVTSGYPNVSYPNWILTKHLGGNFIARPGRPLGYVGHGPAGEGWASNGAGVWVAIDTVGANLNVCRFEPGLNTARALFSAI